MDEVFTMLNKTVKNVKELFRLYVSLIGISDKIILEGDSSVNWKAAYIRVRKDLDEKKYDIKHK